MYKVKGYSYYYKKKQKLMKFFYTKLFYIFFKLITYYLDSILLELTFFIYL